MPLMANRSPHKGASAAWVLDYLTARRFELLLAAIRLQRPFTAQELRRAAGELSTSSLGRDLTALEAAGLITGDPPAGRPRQGRAVRYTVTETPVAVFQELVGAISVTVQRNLQT